MATVVLFHHAQGLTTGVAAFAETLRAAGHTVHVPDLYDGHTFDTLEVGIAHARELGFQNILDSGVAAGDALGDGLVYAGFSLGVMPAQLLAQTRPGARGALLLNGCIPLAEFGGAWPAGLPVQIHGMEEDPEFVGGGDFDAAREIVETAETAELFLYPGSAHLFADSSLDSYDADAAALLTRRVLDFLRDL